MNGILSKIGLCSIALLILYVIRKVYDYFYFKKEDNEKYKIDDDDDEL